MPNFVQTACATSFILCLMGGDALAQTAGHSPHNRAPNASQDRDQNVVFDDDLLGADIATPLGDPVFTGHARKPRAMLIRPRTSFVPELYRSVEQI